MQSGVHYTERDAVKYEEVSSAGLYERPLTISVPKRYEKQEVECAEPDDAP